MGKQHLELLPPLYRDLVLLGLGKGPFICFFGTSSGKLSIVEIA